MDAHLHDRPRYAVHLGEFLEVEIDDGEYMLLRERDVQGVSTGEAEKAPGQYL